MLTYVADVMLDEPLTKVRWLTNDRILASTTHGNVYQLKLDKDDQNVECLSKAKLVYSAEHCAAIWDMATINSGNNLISIEVLKARINEVENSRKKLKEKNGQLMNRVSM